MFFKRIREILDNYFLGGRGVEQERIRRSLAAKVTKKTPGNEATNVFRVVIDVIKLPITILWTIYIWISKMYSRIVDIIAAHYAKYISSWGERYMSSRAQQYEENNMEPATLVGKTIDSQQAHVRRSKVIRLFIRALFTAPVRWIFNNASYATRLFFLTITWFAFYSLQFAGDSQFLYLLCSSDNFLFRNIAKFLYTFVFEAHHIWYIPFIWIGIWLFSLLLQWIWDLFTGVVWLNVSYRNAGGLATINLAQFQLFEFGIFLMSFVLLLLNVKNSTVSINFFDQTSFQLFGFNYSKAIVISCLCFILYGCFLLNVLQLRKQAFALWKMPVAITLFVVLFLNLVCILHTSSLLLIIMCLETFGLTILFFMWLNLEKLSASIVMKSILKFFMAQAIASLLYLYGMSWLSVEFVTLSSMSVSRVIFSNLQNISLASWCINGFTYLILGLIMKIGIGPMGFWIFSVIRQLSYATIAVYFTFIKLTYFLTLISILQQFLGVHWENGVFLQSNIKFTIIFIGIGVLSLIIGTFGLFTTDNLKTFLAYSSFVNFGLLLPAIYYGGMNNLAFAFSLPYAYIYSLTTLVFVWLLAQYSNLKNDHITDLQNLGATNLKVSVLHTLLLTSLAGLPPFGGFFCKFYVLRELFVKMPETTILLIVLSVLAAIGYGRILTNIFLTNATKTVEVELQSTNDSITKLINFFSYLTIISGLFVVLFFGIVLYYNQIEICQISWEFATQFYDATVLPQRDWLPFFENLKVQDRTINDHAMWQYFDTVDRATQKLKIYLKSN